MNADRAVHCSVHRSVHSIRSQTAASRDDTWPTGWRWHSFAKHMSRAAGNEAATALRCPSVYSKCGQHSFQFSTVRCGTRWAVAGGDGEHVCGPSARPAGNPLAPAPSRPVPSLNDRPVAATRAPRRSDRTRARAARVRRVTMRALVARSPWSSAGDKLLIETRTALLTALNTNYRLSSHLHECRCIIFITSDQSVA